MKRHGLCAVALALAVVVLPASGGAQQPAERIILDMTMWVQPVYDADTCFELPPGQVRLESQALGEQPLQAIRILFYGHGRIDDTAATVRLVEHLPQTDLVDVRGGVYCYHIHMDTEMLATTPAYLRANAARRIAVRLTSIPTP